MLCNSCKQCSGGFTFSAGNTQKIRNLRDPSVKMSKSAVSAQSRVELTDSDDVIWQNIRRSVTDCTSQVTYDPDNRPGVSNLIEVRFMRITAVHEADVALKLLVLVLGTAYYIVF